MSYSAYLGFTPYWLGLGVQHMGVRFLILALLKGFRLLKYSNIIHIIEGSKCLIGNGMEQHWIGWGLL